MWHVVAAVALLVALLVTRWAHELVRAWRSRRAKVLDLPLEVCDLVASHAGLPGAWRCVARRWAHLRPTPEERSAFVARAAEAFVASAETVESSPAVIWSTLNPDGSIATPAPSPASSSHTVTRARIDIGGLTIESESFCWALRISTNGRAAVYLDKDTAGGVLRGSIYARDGGTVTFGRDVPISVLEAAVEKKLDWRAAAVLASVMRDPGRWGLTLPQ